jgi:predicted Co/Zn/Cd cation transporter (cation efflux family)
MSYVNDVKDPELLFVIDKEDDNTELQNIERMINNMNVALVDSGFENYQYKLEVTGKKAYVRKVA